MKKNDWDFLWFLFMMLAYFLLGVWVGMCGK